MSQQTVKFSAKLDAPTKSWSDATVAERNQQPRQAITSKGTFAIRYAYSPESNPETTILVILDTFDTKPFEGEFGDEIPLTKEGKKKYNLVLK